MQVELITMHEAVRRLRTDGTSSSKKQLVEFMWLVYISPHGVIGDVRACAVHSIGISNVIR